MQLASRAVYDPRSGHVAGVAYEDGGQALPAENPAHNQRPTGPYQGGRPAHRREENRWNQSTAHRPSLPLLEGAAERHLGRRYEGPGAVGGEQLDERISGSRLS